jgi:hypothetical protein
MNSLVRGWVNLRNSLDWALRNSLTWSPPARERAEQLEAPDEAEGKRIADYQLESARDRMTWQRWQRNLTVLERLELAANSSALVALLKSTSPLLALDVGSKNFDYVDALQGFWRHREGEREVQLTGLEIDAYRRYTDVRTRRAWAQHYASFCPGARYVVGDLQRHNSRYHVITWFFPFVTEFPLLRWGLPLGLFQPAALLAHALSLLEPEGVLILVNQTDAEVVVQRHLLAELEVAYEAVGPRLTVVARCTKLSKGFP